MYVQHGSYLFLRLGLRILSLDAFLDKVLKDETGIYTEDQLVHICMDMFLAGAETTSKTQEVSQTGMITSVYNIV